MNILKMCFDFISSFGSKKKVGLSIKEEKIIQDEWDKRVAYYRSQKSKKGDAARLIANSMASAIASLPE